MSSHHIRRLLEDHDLEERPAEDDEVAGYWQKALRAYADSRVLGLSPQGAFNAAYEAALDAATALVRGAGYRVTSRTRHHWAAFHAVQGLEGDELGRLARELDDARTDRHQNVYGAGDDREIAAKRREKLHHVLRSFLPVAYRFLLGQRPGLRGQLQDPDERL